MRRAWLGYWRRRAAKAAVLMLRALDERTLRDLGFKADEVEGLLKGVSLVGHRGDRRRCR